MGRPTGDLLRVADAAADAALALDRRRIGRRIETSGRTVEEAAGLVLAGTGWLDAVAPGPAGRSGDEPA